MPEETNHEVYLDDLPDEVTATLEARDRALAALGSAAGGLEFLIDNLRSWLPGSTLRVAFLGGTTSLHRDIAEVAEAIADHCNLKLDFGFDPEGGTFRTWSEQDQTHSAEIRVSFDQKGNFSLVGTDSTSPAVGPPDGKVGGRPFQRSLNLGGFHIQKPQTWRGTVLHEFLHALGFHHEHANFRGPCQESFRWEDDPGYQPTRDARGVFVEDSQGRRPGIYTYLSGFPNFWSRTKVDHNLRTVTGTGIQAGTFDRRSVMLYRFPPLFYRTPNSDCRPLGNGQSLSSGDQAGLLELYPQDQAMVDSTLTTKTEVLSSLQTQLSSSTPGGAIAEASVMDGMEAPAARDILTEVVEHLNGQLQQ